MTGVPYAVIGATLRADKREKPRGNLIARRPTLSASFSDLCNEIPADHREKQPQIQKLVYTRKKLPGKMHGALAAVFSLFLNFIASVLVNFTYVTACHRARVCCTGNRLDLFTIKSSAYRLIFLFNQKGPLTG